MTAKVNCLDSEAASSNYVSMAAKATDPWNAINRDEMVEWWYPGSFLHGALYDSIEIPRFVNFLKESGVTKIHIHAPWFHQILPCLPETRIKTLCLEPFDNDITDGDIDSHDIRILSEVLPDTQISRIEFRNAIMVESSADLFVEAVLHSKIAELYIEADQFGNNFRKRVIMKLAEAEIQIIMNGWEIKLIRN